MSDLDRDEIVLDGPLEFTYHGRDTQAWRWFLNGHEVVVEISMTAMEADPDTLSDRVREARLTRGESEVTRYLSWPVPPPTVNLTTEDD